MVYDDKFEIVEGIFVSVSEFRGKNRIDIRKWYTDKTGDLKPTQKGINLSIEEWEDFYENFNEAVKFIKPKI